MQGLSYGLPGQELTTMVRWLHYLCLSGFLLSASVQAADLENGELLFDIGGCASCHAVDKAKDDARLVLEGGQILATPFGDFAVPNISPHPVQGIGGWTEAQFVVAMTEGRAPDGKVYYPAFPYESYARMTLDDLGDLWVFLQTLPASDRVNNDHDLGFPYNIRMGLSGWQAVFVSEAPIIDVGDDPEVLRGQYLTESVGHCGVCHTPRTFGGLGGLDTGQWLAGAPHPEGRGRVPGLLPSSGDFGDWSIGDIVEALTSGFTPEYDSLGSTMAHVVDNTARLPEADRRAIAAYLKALP